MSGGWLEEWAKSQPPDDQGEYDPSDEELAARSERNLIRRRREFLVSGLLYFVLLPLLCCTLAAGARALLR